MRLVIDTNIFISALLKSRTARSVLKASISKRFTLCTSDLLMEELVGVIRRPKFRDRILDRDAAEWLELVREKSVVAARLPQIAVCRDPKDDVILATALATKSQMIVTGDQDLLSLRAYRGIRILTIRQFLNRFGKA